MDQEIEISFAWNARILIALLIIAFAVPNAFEKYAKRDLYNRIDSYTINAMIEAQIYKKIDIERITEDENKYIKALRTLTLMVDHYKRDVENVKTRFDELENAKHLIEDGE